MLSLHYEGFGEEARKRGCIAARCLVVATLCMAGSGCREASEETGRSGVGVDSSTVWVTDSAGAEIVRISDLHALDLPELPRRLVYSTAADLELYHVSGAVFLPDSSLAIADRGSSQVILLDRHGSARERVGREGEGPGEYEDIEWIGVGADGNLSVYDGGLGRFTFLEPSGRVTGVLRFDMTHAIAPLVHLAGGEFLAVLETRPFRPLGFQRGPLFLVIGDQSGAVVDTLGRWAGKERFVTPGRMIRVGFAATALYAGRSSHAAVATTDSLDVTLYEGTEPLTRIRGGHSPREVTSREKEDWVELALDIYPEAMRPARREVLAQSKVRDTYPAFGALKVDADGGIWIGGYARLEDVERRWTVFGPDGTPLGMLNLPVYRPERLKIGQGTSTGWGVVELESTIPSAWHELLDVAGGLLAVLRTGKLGEEFIEVYEVEVPR